MHSPLILCSMAFSTMVYLSACTFVLEGDLYRQAKDLVQVSIGTFKVYEEVWPISARTLGQIKATARGVFAPSNARPSPGNDILNPSIAATYSSKSTYTSQAVATKFREGAVDKPLEYESISRYGKQRLS
jgi:hypothetical protein